MTSPITTKTISPTTPNAAADVWTKKTAFAASDDWTKNTASPTDDDWTKNTASPAAGDWTQKTTDEADETAAPADNNTEQPKSAEYVTKKQRWRALVMERKAFQPITDIACSIFRPYDNEKRAYVTFPGKEFHATKRIVDFTNTAEAHDLIRKEPAYKVGLVMPVDFKVAKQQIKVLRAINNEFNNNGYTNTYDILLGRRMCDLPRSSMFNKTGCALDLLNNLVATYTAHLETNSTVEQVDAFHQLHNSTQVFMLVCTNLPKPLGLARPDALYSFVRTNSHDSKRGRRYSSERPRHCHSSCQDQVKLKLDISLHLPLDRGRGHPSQRSQSFQSLN
jgi:hypothetical protein